MARIIPSLILCCTLGMSAAWGETVGWRGDGTGKYPDAKPVTRWSAEKNVVWKTPMPSRSNSSPIVVSGRVFVCSEPFTLVCVRASDGKILWQRANPSIKTLPEVERAPMLAKLKGIDAETKVKRWHELEQKTRTLRQKVRSKPDDKKLKAEYDKLNGEFDAAAKEVAPYERFFPHGTHKVNGYSTPTPVSDGKHVWVTFGNGVAACYDLDGNRRWIVFVKTVMHEQGFSASPILVDGKLIVSHELAALDAATGKTIWRRGYWPAWGTPTPARIGGVDVFAGAWGGIYRVSDGERLARGLSTVTFCSPVLEGNRLYYVEAGGRGLKLPDEAAPGMKPETLFTFGIRKDRYYASPVVHDGLVYAVTRKNRLSVIDAADGTVVHERRLTELGRGEHNIYSSITFAGGYLFITNVRGKTLVLRPGRNPEIVAENDLEPVHSCLVFGGSRMYVRGFKHLWCIGK